MSQAPSLNQDKPKHLSVGEIIALLALIVGVLVVITPMVALSRSFFLLIVLGASIYLCWRSPWPRTFRSRTFLTVILSLTYVITVALLFVVEARTPASIPAQNPPSGGALAVVSSVGVWAKARVLGVWALPWRWILLGAVLSAFAFSIITRLRSGKSSTIQRLSTEVSLLQAQLADESKGLSIAEERGCQDEWLHEVAKTDKTSIEKLIRIVGILYNPDFEKAHIDFTLCVFNISLYPIAIDNAIKKGAIRFGEDNEKFFYPANIESEHPIDCPSRGDAFFVIRQAIRAEEIERLRKEDNYLIRFYDLEIMFQGGKHFPQADPLRLDVREHYVETQKRMWRAWDQAGFVFGYNEKQWDLLSSSSNIERLASLETEIESLKSQLANTSPQKPLPPEFDCMKHYFDVVTKRDGYYRKAGETSGPFYHAVFLDFQLNRDSHPGELALRAEIIFREESGRDWRVPEGVWHGRQSVQIPLRHGETQSLIVTTISAEGSFTTYENRNNQHPRDSPLERAMRGDVLNATVIVTREFNGDVLPEPRVWHLRISKANGLSVTQVTEDGQERVN